MKRGLFVTVFVYTFVFLLVIVGVTVVLFARQFMAFYQTSQIQQLTDIFQPLTQDLYRKTPEELVAIAQNFAIRNQSYAFIIEDTNGNVIFSTPGSTEAMIAPGAGGAIRLGVVPDTPALVDSIPVPDTDKPAQVYAVPVPKSVAIITSAPQDIVININRRYLANLARNSDASETITMAEPENRPAQSGFLFNFTSSGSTDSGVSSVGYILRGANTVSIQGDYRDLISKSLLALAIMLLISIGGAFVFARQLTRPITRLADTANLMARLEEVGVPAAPNNEIGQLARDMYRMYEALGQTIAELKTEIAHERAMEEQQRYFFAAASHELKTPIAAASALVEGMIANIGDYQNHEKYLRECLKTVGTQNRLISEILEIVTLSDDKALVFEPVSLSELLASILTEYRPLAERNDLHIELDVVSDTIVCADRALLRRALSNVTANAVQNTPERQTIRVWTEAAGDRVRLYVLNHGTRIADTARPFEPFYRADTARSSGQGRSGLGLTIVKKALERMRFPFALENSGDGVCFWVVLVSDTPLVDTLHA
jgi:two-component system sensor histidine kinase VanS